MAFRDLGVNFSYETLNDDPVVDFYIPILRNAIRYDRIAGFFSSSSLAIAARGISGLIANDGKMRLIASPILSIEDAKIIAQNQSIDPTIAAKLAESLDEFANVAARDHISALGWMLINGFLEIRLAMVLSEENTIDKTALFHQKIGIMEDINGDKISFSGSINETASGWLTNSEEFKVFKSWEVGQDSYFTADETKFSSLWNGQNGKVLVLPAPEAIRNRLVHIGKEFNKENFIAKEYVRRHIEKTVAEKLSLYEYQKKAKDMWINNGYKLFFEMATGTGKTRTAIACINYFINNEQTGLIIIACPQTTLSLQWRKEIEAIGLKVDCAIIADGNHRWRDALSKQLKLLSIGFSKHTIVYTTHTTASSEDFIRRIKDYLVTTPVCFIGDEAHGLGAYKTKRALLEEYWYRIGLSATPIRWFDEYGTKILVDFFGNNSYQFTISQALTTINPLTGMPFLSDYEYHPIFVNLIDDEIMEYRELSKRISKMATYSENSDEYQKILNQLLYRRADIEKNAILKYNALQEILETYPIKNTIIFTSDEQIDEVMRILQKMDIMAHRFTQDQGTNESKLFGGLSERQYLINMFKDGTYRALVAIKCLDEGIDIPSADTAILMASSTNPREYIQRIGRVIRSAKKKKRAHIFDFIIEPDFSRLKDSELIAFEKKIFEKELIRVKDMSSNSINNADVLVSINERVRRLTNGTKYSNH